MIQLFRLYAYLHRLGVPVLPRCLYVLNRILFAVVLPPSVRVGARVTFAYQGLGVVVHERAVLGSDIYVGAQVVIGGRGGRHEVPVIHDGAFLGVGAKILGPVTIGAGAKVAAGAVVLNDVAPGVTVAGVPARPVPARAVDAAPREME
ncbi:serine O-acetyltransferase [Rugamonas apoptosis]|uniref:Serine acetyltransferase n=1 Tax=Rugamonas apoptosis TaxID=2758570 RepID=A0A7W2IN21_9BURK|nr:serine acetyltransferase [Rugamonas apoptosis]MBA5690092.1 serine acetyltransferase [Rugamonas apoptosis]